MIYDPVSRTFRILGDGCFAAGTPVLLSSVPTSKLAVAVIGGARESCIFDNTIESSTFVVPIEEVPLGSRIATQNPHRDDIDDSLPEPDSTWKQVRMQFQRKNGSRVDIELLRPVEWIERHRLEAGAEIFMSNAEIEVRGTGRVLAIEDCPPIADGEGSVVIARIKTHRAGHLVELQFENGETLTGTASHPIWSADRQDWVPLGELQEGEHTQSRDGHLKITRRIALPDMQPVYNLEVHGEHVYEVTQAGVLVHNNDCLEIASAAAQGFKNLECHQCADAIRKALANKGLTGTTLKIRAGKGPYMIHKATGRVISTSGVHEAVRVGDMVFDNLHPNGIPFEEWKIAYDAPLGVHFY